MKRPVSTRDKFASKRKQKRVSDTWRAVSAELSICATLLSAKFYRCPPFGVKLPPPCLLAKFYLVSTFLSIVPTSATASFGRFYRYSQSVFNRAVCFVVKFCCRPRLVRSPLVYRKTPAQNKAHCLYCPAFTYSPQSRKF